jgi:hypothetical protein
MITKRFKALGLMALMAVMLFVLIVPQTMAAYSVKQVFVRVSGTAGETVTTGQVVAIKDADGEWYKADANDSDVRPGVGIVGSKTGGDGESIEVILEGVLTGWSSLTEGQPGYLSETAGAVTQSAPSWVQQVGVALSTTDYYFNLKNYFDSSAVTSLGVLSGASPIIAEGATANDFETTISITDPTADNTITLPDDSGSVAYSPGGTTTSIADSLAIPITHAYVAKTTGGDAEALTLANGENGQILTIALVTDGGGVGTLTPVTCSGFATIAFEDAGDNVTLMYIDDTVGWIILGTAGVAAPPVITI